MRHPVNVITVVKHLAAIAAIFFAVGNGVANATFIDFDELPYDPEHPEFYAHPVTDQYASQGLVIDSGFLLQYWSGSENIISSPNYLLAGIGMDMTFLGEAPTFVGMYVNSWRQEAIFFDFYGDSGLIASLKTKGYAGPEDDVPYEPNQFISFAAAEGIRSINVTGFYGRSTAGEIDDLTFTYGVPEPSSLVLLGLGLLLVIIKSNLWRFGMHQTVNLIAAVKQLAAIAIISFAVGNGVANAAFIDFDDLPYDHEYPLFDSHPVTDQYVSQGLLFSDAFLRPYWEGSENIVSSPNYLMAGVGLDMTFLGEAPTFVSMYVNSWRHEIIYFDFYGDSGLIGSLKTKGFTGPFGEDFYEPNQFISFAAEEGIRKIYVNRSNGRALAGEIDDLTFTYGVPEPSSLVLLGLGLLLVMRKRQKFPV